MGRKTYTVDTYKPGLVWERVTVSCRQQNKHDSKIKICFGKGRKHCGRSRKCWLPAFSPVPAIFSKGLYLTVVKSQDCVVKVHGEGVGIVTSACLNLA